MDGAFTVIAVDDDPIVRDLLSDYLTECGYQVRTADGGIALRALLEDTVPHAVLLDVNMPGEDGLSLARYLREHLDVAVIMVSAASDPLDRIVGLEVGADDYITKPFELRELRARLKNILRRYQKPSGEVASPAEVVAADKVCCFGAYRLNVDSHQLIDDQGREIPLTAMEFDLLRAFAERPNRPLTRDQILNLTQNRDWDPFDRSIDLRIARLRRKLESDPEKPQIIRTVRGVGYMFVPASNGP